MEVDYRSLNLYFVTTCQEMKFFFLVSLLALTTFGGIFHFVARCQNKVSL